MCVEAVSSGKISVDPLSPCSKKVSFSDRFAVKKTTAKPQNMWQHYQHRFNSLSFSSAVEEETLLKDPLKVEEKSDQKLEADLNSNSTKSTIETRFSIPNVRSIIERYALASIISPTSHFGGCKVTFLLIANKMRYIVRTEGWTEI